MDFFSSSYEHTNSFNVLLPNLRYKKNSDKLYFKSKHPIKLKINNKNVFKDEFVLKDLSFSQTLNYNGIDIHCNIIKIEYDDGLKMNIKYNSNEYNYMSFMQKVAKFAEGCILGVNIDDLESRSVDYSNDNYHDYIDKASIYSEEYNDEETEINDNIDNNNNDDSLLEEESADITKYYDDKN